MESYTAFLLQSRNPDNWVSRLPDDLIKNVCNYLSIVPSFDQVKMAPNKWKEEFGELQRVLISYDNYIHAKEIKLYAEKTLPERLAKEAGYHGHWIPIAEDGNKIKPTVCWVREPGGDCNLLPQIRSVENGVPICAKYHHHNYIFEAMRKYETFRESIKK